MKFFYIYNIAAKFNASGKNLDRKILYGITIAAVFGYMIFSGSSQLAFWLGRPCRLTDYFNILITAYLAINIFIVQIIDFKEEPLEVVLVQPEIKKSEPRVIKDDFIFRDKIFYDFKKERVDQRLSNDIPEESFSPPEEDLSEQVAELQMPEDINFDKILHINQGQINETADENESLSAEEQLRKDLNELL